MSEANLTPQIRLMVRPTASKITEGDINVPDSQVKEHE